MNLLVSLSYWYPYSDAAMKRFKTQQRFRAWQFLQVRFLCRSSWIPIPNFQARVRFHGSSQTPRFRKATARVRRLHQFQLFLFNYFLNSKLVLYLHMWPLSPALQNPSSLLRSSLFLSPLPQRSHGVLYIRFLFVYMHYWSVCVPESQKEVTLLSMFNVERVCVPESQKNWTKPL